MSIENQENYSPDIRTELNNDGSNAPELAEKYGLGSVLDELDEMTIKAGLADKALRAALTLGNDGAEMAKTAARVIENSGKYSEEDLELARKTMAS
jgi:hypothetical protein